jgi:hypothetical protein
MLCNISTRGILVVKALCYKPEGRWFDTQLGDFSIYLILPAALGPGDYSASGRNEYRKQKSNVCGSRARPVHRDDNLTAIYEPIV